MSQSHQGCICLIKNTVKTEMLLQFKVTIFCVYIFYNVIYFCDDKAEFSALLFQPSEIIII